MPHAMVPTHRGSVAARDGRGRRSGETLTTPDADRLDRLFADFAPAGPVPLYHQLALRLEAAIRSGALPPGARLEGEVQLAARLHLARGTVRHAIQSLVDKGLVERRRGSGTRVVDPTASARERARPR